MTKALDRARATIAAYEGGGAVTVDEVLAARDVVSVEMSKAAVDDPFRPGVKVRPSQASVHPARRLGQSIAGRLAQMDDEASA